MNKHFVIHQDGHKSTRNSLNRVYTHAIELSPENAEAAIARFTRHINHHETMITMANQNIENIKTYGVVFETQANMFNADLFYKVAKVNGKQVGRWVNETETEEEYAAMLIADNEKSIARAEAVIAKTYDDIATTKEQGHWGTYSVVTWCGRYDLAQKQLAKYSEWSSYTARIVEVERVGA